MSYEHFSQVNEFNKILKDIFGPRGVVIASEMATQIINDNNLTPGEFLSAFTDNLDSREHKLYDNKILFSKLSIIDIEEWDMPTAKSQKDDLEELLKQNRPEKENSIDLFESSNQNNFLDNFGWNSSSTNFISKIYLKDYLMEPSAQNFNYGDGIFLGITLNDKNKTNSMNNKTQSTKDDSKQNEESIYDKIIRDLLENNEERLKEVTGGRYKGFNAPKSPGDWELVPIFVIMFEDSRMAIKGKQTDKNEKSMRKANIKTKIKNKNGNNIGIKEFLYFEINMIPENGQEGLQNNSKFIDYIVNKKKIQSYKTTNNDSVQYFVPNLNRGKFLNELMIENISSELIDPIRAHLATNLEARANHFKNIVELEEKNSKQNIVSSSFGIFGRLNIFGGEKKEAKNFDSKFFFY